ncbi:MAG: hypothetical protein ABJF23_28980 [Bryobacteraceae bacterium]
MRYSLAIPMILLMCGCSKAPEAVHAAHMTSPAAKPVVVDAEFWKIWGDGQAELAGYDLTYPRYGQLRMGVAVTIFVSETFSNQLRVKADEGKHPASDQYPVMKLNLIQDFQTGIYDYNNMTSTFAALAAVNGRPAGSPTKVSFSEQEWCGHVYQQLLFDASAVRSQSHSYFDGEGDQDKQLSYPEGGVTEDQLPLWARGMAAPVLAVGEKREVMLLPALQSVRHAHKPIEWKQATLSRTAGSGDTEIYSAKFEGFERKFTVEKAAPHRILRWETSAGERAELLKSARLKYWQMHNEGGEAALAQLGLHRRAARTP